MTFAPGAEELWKKGLEVNQKDPYGARIYEYALDWANLMEDEIAKGKKLEDVAVECDRKANYDGITGFMYGAAVSILSQAWVHGETLRRWHNLKIQIGTEGEKANENGGVLNPALMNFGEKE